MNLDSLSVRPRQLIMLLLLASQFRSYIQPVIIMMAIPFGLIGAILGHLVMGIEFTMVSIFGIVALSGIVVNDSLILIDFINRAIRSGVDIHKAVIESGKARFRPVLLTSVTTIAGLFPLLLERLNIFTDPQKPIQVKPGVYEINDPGPEAPVLVTTNFSITYFSVANEVESAGAPAWLLVTESEGMSVLTAWAAGKFDAELALRLAEQTLEYR